MFKLEEYSLLNTKNGEYIGDISQMKHVSDNKLLKETGKQEIGQEISCQVTRCSIKNPFVLQTIPDSPISCNYLASDIISSSSGDWANEPGTDDAITIGNNNENEKVGDHPKLDLDYSEANQNINVVTCGGYSDDVEPQLSEPSALVEHANYVVRKDEMDQYCGDQREDINTDSKCMMTGDTCIENCSNATDFNNDFTSDFSTEAKEFLNNYIDYLADTQLSNLSNDLQQISECNEVPTPDVSTNICLGLNLPEDHNKFINPNEQMKEDRIKKLCELRYELALKMAKNDNMINTYLEHHRGRCDTLLVNDAFTHRIQNIRHSINLLEDNLEINFQNLSGENNFDNHDNEDVTSQESEMTASQRILYCDESQNMSQNLNTISDSDIQIFHSVNNDNNDDNDSSRKLHLDSESIYNHINEFSYNKELSTCKEQQIEKLVEDNEIAESESVAFINKFDSIGQKSGESNFGTFQDIHSIKTDEEVDGQEFQDVEDCDAKEVESVDEEVETFKSIDADEFKIVADVLKDSNKNIDSIDCKESQILDVLNCDSCENFDKIPACSKNIECSIDVICLNTEKLCDDDDDDQTSRVLPEDYQGCGNMITSEDIFMAYKDTNQNNFETERNKPISMELVGVEDLSQVYFHALTTDDINEHQINANDLIISSNIISSANQITNDNDEQIDLQNNFSSQQDVFGSCSVPSDTSKDGVECDEKENSNQGQLYSNLNEGNAPGKEVTKEEFEDMSEKTSEVKDVSERSSEIQGKCKDFEIRHGNIDIDADGNRINVDRVDYTTVSSWEHSNTSKETNSDSKSQDFHVIKQPSPYKSFSETVKSPACSPTDSNVSTNDEKQDFDKNSPSTSNNYLHQSPQNSGLKNFNFMVNDMDAGTWLSRSFVNGTSPQSRRDEIRVNSLLNDEDGDEVNNTTEHDYNDVGSNFGEKVDNSIDSSMMSDNSSTLFNHENNKCQLTSPKNCSPDDGDQCHDSTFVHNHVLDSVGLDGDLRKFVPGIPNTLVNNKRPGDKNKNDDGEWMEEVKRRKKCKKKDFYDFSVVPDLDSSKDGDDSQMMFKEGKPVDFPQKYDGPLKLAKVIEVREHSTSSLKDVSKYEDLDPEVIRKFKEFIDNDSKPPGQSLIRLENCKRPLRLGLSKRYKGTHLHNH